MTLDDFINDNEAEIDKAIQASRNRHREHNPMTPVRLNRADRKSWVLNDYTLYRWALSQGVKGI